VQFLRKIFLSPDVPPMVVQWMQLPSLSVAIFGSIEKTPDIDRIRLVYNGLVTRAFPSKEAESETDRDRVQKRYSKLVDENLEFKEIPNVSELGRIDRPSRLFCACLTGMVWLLLDEGATISEHDASLIPAAVSEFAREPLCVMIQGRGHHLFLSSRLARRLCIGDGRSLRSKAGTSGLIAKRVKYIRIDARSNDRFDLL
jgi:hypothetical protein